MTHLSKAEPTGLFTTTVPERPKSKQEGQVPMAVAWELPPMPFAVAPTMTPEEKRSYDYHLSNAASVENVATRHRGKHY